VQVALLVVEVGVHALQLVLLLAPERALAGVDAGVDERRLHVEAVAGTAW